MQRFPLRSKRFPQKPSTRRGKLTDNRQMDEEQFAALRRWGEGLRSDAREEVRAAGRAIVLLCDEVDRLEMELWQLRMGSTSRDLQPAGQGAVDPAEAGGSSVVADNAEAELKTRLRRFLTAVLDR